MDIEADLSDLEHITKRFRLWVAATSATGQVRRDATVAALQKEIDAWRRSHYRLCDVVVAWQEGARRLLPTLDKSAEDAITIEFPAIEAFLRQIADWKEA